MKSFVWMVVVLLLVVVVLAVPVRARLAHPAADCTSRVVIVKDQHGAPLECVCIGGTLAACFRPGP